MIKVVHVITGLERGGAEMMLYKLVRTMSREHILNEVISLTSEGSLGKWIREAGIEVRALGMRRGVPDPRIVISLARDLRYRQANVVQTWMYHADLIGGMAARLAGRLPTVWGVRQSNLDPVRSKRLTRFTATVCAHLSRYLPDRIVCCSHEAARVHRELGYEARKMVVIPNGFDLDAFQPDHQARSTIRAEFGLAPDRLVVGMLARFDPQKDHRTFIKAAGILLGHHPEVAFILAGEGISRENAELVGWLKAEGVGERFFLLGLRDDVARILNACDVVTLSSAFGEGFPNVIGEAMSCGIPCVVTDVGDAGRLVDDTGRVVAAGDPQSLAQAWAELLKHEATERQALGEAARRRIAEHFAISKIVTRYSALYLEMAKRSSVSVK